MKTIKILLLMVQFHGTGLCWGHMPFCWFCHESAYFRIITAFFFQEPELNGTMVHNAPSDFANLASGETGDGYQTPQPVSELEKKFVFTKLVQ